MDKAPDFGSGDCRFESCHGRCEVLLCPRSEDWYILDFRDNRKNEICILEKLMVKVRGNDNRNLEENYHVLTLVGLSSLYT